MFNHLLVTRKPQGTEVKTYQSAAVKTYQITEVKTYQGAEVKRSSQQSRNQGRQRLSLAFLWMAISVAWWQQ